MNPDEKAIRDALRARAEQVDAVDDFVAPSVRLARRRSRRAAAVGVTAAVLAVGGISAATWAVMAPAPTPRPVPATATVSPPSPTPTLTPTPTPVPSSLSPTPTPSTTPSATPAPPAAIPPSVQTPQRVKTQVAVLDIYDDAGKVSSKYSFKDYGGDPVDCSQSSPASKGPAVFQCGSPAEYLPACWKNLTSDEGSTVLCLQRPWNTTLLRVPVAGSGVEPLQGEPVPFAVQLVDGTRWHLRLGGAWGHYGKDVAAAYGPEAGDDGNTDVLLERRGEPLFTTSDGTWRVLRGPDVGPDLNARDKAKRVDVAKVWFVSGRWQ